MAYYVYIARDPLGSGTLRYGSWTTIDARVLRCLIALGKLHMHPWSFSRGGDDV
jgi:hypothetical protein